MLSLIHISIAGWQTGQNKVLLLSQLPLGGRLRRLAVELELPPLEEQERLALFRAELRGMALENVTCEDVYKRQQLLYGGQEEEPVLLSWRRLESMPAEGLSAGGGTSEQDAQMEAFLEALDAMASGSGAATQSTNPYYGGQLSLIHI